MDSVGLLIHTKLLNFSYYIVRNIGMELNLVVDKINSVSPNFVPTTSDTSLKTLNTLQFNINWNSMITITYVPLQAFKINQLTLRTKVSSVSALG